MTSCPARRAPWPLDRDPVAAEGERQVEGRQHADAERFHARVLALCGFAGERAAPPPSIRSRTSSAIRPAAAAASSRAHSSTAARFARPLPRTSGGLQVTSPRRSCRGQVGELRVPPQEESFYRVGRAVPVLGNDHLGEALLVGLLLVVVLVAIDEAEATSASCSIEPDSRRSERIGRLSCRCSTARESCDIAAIRTSRSRASTFSEREICRPPRHGSPPSSPRS